MVQFFTFPLLSKSSIAHDTLYHLFIIYHDTVISFCVSDHGAWSHIFHTVGAQ